MIIIIKFNYIRGCVSVSAFVWYRDMVKRLINKMDFEALEVKMKKCKVSIIIIIASLNFTQNHTSLPNTNNVHQ